MNIITNNQLRPILTGFDMPDSAWRNFADYVTNRNDLRFFRYRGEWYDLSEFMISPPELAKLGWDGFMSDTYFSGIAIKIKDDSVIVGRVYA